MPLGGSMSTTTMTVPGRKAETDRANDEGISIRRVSSDYHRALRIPLRSGRLFEATDRKGSPLVIIINESAAKTYFPGEDPIGRAVTINEASRTVVGVVGDVYQSSLETEPRSEAYIPATQARVSFGELIILTQGNPYDVVPAVKAAVLAVMPDVPLRNIRSMEEVLARRVAQRRLNMLLLGLFGLLGLVISAVGIYGVMAYVVSQRTREIGVRMALGATRRGIASMVLREAGVLVAIGVGAGLVLALLSGRFAESLLFGLDSRDPLSIAVAAVLLGSVALLASYLPARAAANIEPTTSLRAE
jgi:predicted permease